MFSLTNEELFKALYKADTEEKVDEIINNYPESFKDENWLPLGGNENMFGIIRNQQSSPIAALVEKVTNSIDAILTKKCLEKGIAPDSDEAPQSMEAAIQDFFPEASKWDLRDLRRKQSEDIQILADGPKRNTSVIIYDNGEGQHPEKFEDTFLSLVRGNKIKIQFVQGKFNMGGSGALVFCGKKRYQLIGSKRFDNTGNFGFTLIRQRRITSPDDNRRSSFFEYLKIDGQIPNFPIKDLDLNLYGRKFSTGTVIKLYSYQFPTGYSGFAQDLNQSLNEFLFEPVLPLLTVDTKERYPKNNVLDLDLFGLKRRLETAQSDYIETYFSQDYTTDLFGKAKVTCYVFKPKQNNNNVKKTKENIKKRFFKNNMSVLFSINGQVHGQYSSEFITRTLKLNLLKDYLLIHVDCTHMHPDFREELFMASRDRLKQGDEAKELRDFLGKKLQKSQLEEINKLRKQSIGLENEDTTDLIRSFAKNLPKNSELFKLLQNTLKLEEKKEDKRKERPKTTIKKEEKPFLPQRYPSKFQLYNKKKEGISMITLPVGEDKTIKFETDVVNDYFDRTDDPGSMEVNILKVKRNETNGGNQAGNKTEISESLNITKSSPNKGIIKLNLEANQQLQVGDEVEIKASLSGPGKTFEEIILVKITDQQASKTKQPKEEDINDSLGLPKLHRIKQEQWDQIESKGIEMDFDTVMQPMSEGDQLQEVYINLDSHVFLNHKSKLKGEEQIMIAERKYISSVYFHTIFLYMISKRRKYSFAIDKEGEQETVTIDDYIKDVFDHYYSDFLLNFGMEQLMGALDE